MKTEIRVNRTSPPFYCHNKTGLAEKDFSRSKKVKYEVWNFNSGNYLFTTDTK